MNPNLARATVGKKKPQIPMAYDTAQLLKEHAEWAVARFRDAAAHHQSGWLEAKAAVQAAMDRYGVAAVRDWVQERERAEAQHTGRF